MLEGALDIGETVYRYATQINALPNDVSVGAPAPRDDRFGVRSNSLALPRNRAGLARPRRPPECPQAPIALVWRALAAYIDDHVDNFAYFVERADPFDVRFTLPVVMCACFDSESLDSSEFKKMKEIDREIFTLTFGRAVTNEAIGFHRDHSPELQDYYWREHNFSNLARAMVDGSAEQIKFLMMGAHGGCGECARLAMDHLEREDPAREGPRPFFLKFPAGTARGPAGHAATIAKLSALLRRPGAASPTSVDAVVEDMEKLNVSVEIEPTRESHIQSPDPSGALYVLSLLDKLDDQEARARAAAPAGQQNAPASKPSAWRRASKDDYGVAMRAALEELAESDRRERVRSL